MSRRNFIFCLSMAAIFLGTEIFAASGSRKSRDRNSLNNGNASVTIVPSRKKDGRPADYAKRDDSAERVDYAKRADYAAHADSTKHAGNSSREKITVQVPFPNLENITGTEAAWLPGQIQDKIKSNVQEFLDMRVMTDSRAESQLRQLQAESESNARDQDSAIELGKITTAHFALFTKLRRTSSGYILTADYTNLTTGEQLASVTSREYTRPEFLYGSTGAVDEITVLLASKLGISLSPISARVLKNGSSGFTVEEQLALTKQNEDRFRKIMLDYDAQLEKLMASTDINALQNKARLEAAKALLMEKQNSELKRQEELKAQKLRAEEDRMLEAERSIALKTHRDQLAKEAAAKAAQVRSLKLAGQGIFGQISMIESKKKALLEIREDVEKRCLELYVQLEKNRVEEELRIRSRPLGISEKDSAQMQTEESKRRRENQVAKSYEDLTEKFYSDCKAVKDATMTQQTSLLEEIESDQKSLASIHTVSSMGDELKVSISSFTGALNGWLAHLSLYSDGILIYTDSFVISYRAVSGKDAPTEKELIDYAVADEYDASIDMYNSLLTRGEPIIYFELDYSVGSNSEFKPSHYQFNFKNIRVINTISGQVTQTSRLNKTLSRTFKPELDIMEKPGIAEKERMRIIGEQQDAENREFFESLGLNLVKIPGIKIQVLDGKVSQELFDSIMNGSPVRQRQDKSPAVNVSWIDAICFCNRLSEKCGYTPVYSVDGTTDISSCMIKKSGKHYYPDDIYKKIVQNASANGFRLPTNGEWEYASQARNLKKKKNVIGPLPQKMEDYENYFGLKDMWGRIWEWVWDSGGTYGRNFQGGAYDLKSYNIGEGYYRIVRGGAKEYNSLDKYPNATEFTWKDNGIGFRIVQSCTDGK